MGRRDVSGLLGRSGLEATTSVTVGTVLRMDPSLLCAVRSEQARDEVTRDDVRRVAVSPAVPLPSLGLFTHREAIGQPVAVQEFARVARSEAVSLPAKRRRACPRPRPSSIP